MRKPENTFISGVHKYMPPDNALHREKMNNPYRSGTADWWYSGNAADMWIEYKYSAELPVRDKTVVVPSLSPMQQVWTKRRYEEGRHVRVVLGSKAGAVVFYTPEEWLDGLEAGLCRSRLVSRQTLAELITMHCSEGVTLAPSFTDGGEVRRPTR